MAYYLPTVEEKYRFDSFYGIWHIANVGNVSQVMHEFYSAYMAASTDEPGIYPQHNRKERIL